MSKALQLCPAQLSVEAAINITVWGEEDQPCSVFVLCAYAAVAVQNFSCSLCAEPVSSLHRLLGESGPWWDTSQ